MDVNVLRTQNPRAQRQNARLAQEIGNTNLNYEGGRRNRCNSKNQRQVIYNSKWPTIPSVTTKWQELPAGAPTVCPQCSYDHAAKTTSPTLEHFPKLTKS